METVRRAPDSVSDQPPTPAQLRELRLQRNLKILVAALGFLIVAGVIGLIIRVVYLANAPSGAQPAARIAGGSPSSLALELPAGARIVSVSISGNRLAVHHEGSAGSAIAIIDIDTGARITDVRPFTAPPRN